MLNVMCLDMHGNTVYNLTQWDHDQKLVIEDNYSEYHGGNAPLVQFCNKNSDRALGVRSTLSNGNIIADIPNSLLREPYNIVAYIFVDETDSGKVIETVTIPVHKRVQPTDYEYTDNIDVVYLRDLITQITNLNAYLNDNENTRISAETVRIANENQRIANEAQRQTSTAAVIQASREQTEACETATRETLEAKELVDSMLYDIDGGNAFTNPDYMFQIDGGNSDGNNGSIGA